MTLLSLPIFSVPLPLFLSSFLLLSTALPHSPLFILVCTWCEQTDS